MQEAISIIEQIAKDNKNCFFAYYTSDDIQQTVWDMCLDALKRYDKKRGSLEHFLRKHVHNRLLNLKRDVYFNFSDEEEISLKKMNIVNAIPMHSISCEEGESGFVNLLPNRNHGSEPYDYLVAEELKQYIISRLDKDLVTYFIDIINGNKIKKQILQRLQLRVREILKEYSNETT